MRGKRAKLLRRTAKGNKANNTYVWENYSRIYTALGYDEATILRKFYRRAKRCYKAWRKGLDTVI